MLQQYSKQKLAKAVAITLTGFTLTTLVGCQLSTLKFTGVNAPATDAEKREIIASPSIVIDLPGNKDKEFPIAFHTLVRSGDQFPSGTFGQLYDAEGNPLVGEDGEPVISNSNEHTSLIPVGSKLFSVSQHETRPGVINLMELDQDKKTGELTVTDVRNIDLAGVRGGWTHCAASVTPWNTHLASEEYEPNADAIDPVTGDGGSYYNAMADYYGGDLFALNPYDYGWNIEVAILNEAGDVNVEKHYAMGRAAIELSKVMPDSKTAYMTDDGTNVGLYMFVADKKGDLSAGNLYAMKWHQTSAEGAGAADLSWISLGHATDAQIKSYLNAKITFNDIFESVDPAEDFSCAEGFTSINTSSGQECLKVKEGMEVAASRMETRRYAAMMGATTELRKEEGIAFDIVGKRLFIAMSEVERGMEDFMKDGNPSTSYDKGGNNDIRLNGYNLCGAVYALDVGWDEEIGSAFVAKNMYGLLEGIPTSDTVVNPEPFNNSQNTCHIDGIANPDNLTFIDGQNTLIIGEDTGSGHQNDAIWSYNLASKELTRIQTTPYGSETTSPYWYPNINGFAYLMSVVQHPYGESDKDQATGDDDRRAYTGYIGPFPVMGLPAGK